jgi:hypothetical protein
MQIEILRGPCVAEYKKVRLQRRNLPTLPLSLPPFTRLAALDSLQHVAHVDLHPSLERRYSLGCAHVLPSSAHHKRRSRRRALSHRLCGWCRQLSFLVRELFQQRYCRHYMVCRLQLGHLGTRRHQLGSVHASDLCLRVSDLFPYTERVLIHSFPVSLRTTAQSPSRPQTSLFCQHLCNSLILT